MKPTLVALLGAVALIPAACGSETSNQVRATTTSPTTISTTTTEPAPFELAMLSREGGCGKTVYMANETWTQVIQFSLGRAGDFEPGVPIEFEIGDGVSATLSVGEKMFNLFCNDTIEGNERIDSVYTATSGTVLVTLDAPYEDNVGVIASVVASDLVFETDPPATVKSLTATATIGWFPG